ncbi:MAG: beta-carotene 15,15'-monooxygenase, partial [Scardovia wiggsiae]|nr:beta-carotene 15,15'-monooxygenase [Scardovia wiggsiae]
MGYLMAGPEAADSAAASVPGTASSPFHQPQHPRLARFWLILRWTAVSLVCAWMALCTAVGPLYRANSSITSFRAHNWILLITFFAGYMGIVGIAVNISQAHSRIRGIWRCAQSYILDTVGPAAVRLCRDSGMMLRSTVRKVAVRLRAGRSAPDRNAAKTSAKDAERKPSGRKGKAKRIAGIAAQAIQ